MGKKLVIILVVIILVLLIAGFFVYKYVFAARILSVESEQVISCKDPDGYDIYHQATTTYERDEPGESSIYNSPDMCFDYHPKIGNAQIVREDWCEGNVYKSAMVKCPYGYTCADGECRK